MEQLSKLDAILILASILLLILLQFVFVVDITFVTPTQKNSSLTPSGWNQENVTVRLNLVYYNRIPKTGSTTFVGLISLLAKQNEFYHAHDQTYRPHAIRNRILVKKYIGNLLNYNPDQWVLYDRHLHFTDFSLYDAPQPIWINLVRDPIEQYISSFYFERRIIFRPSNRAQLRNYKLDKGEEGFQKWLNASLDDCVHNPSSTCIGIPPDGKTSGRTSIPYFCGHDRGCALLGSEWALVQALDNIDKWYLVIGVLEDFDKTLAVFERILPRYFKGALDLYNQTRKNPKIFRNNEEVPVLTKRHWKKNVRFKRSFVSNRNPHPGISESTRIILKTKLHLEYDLYNYIVQRLNLQASVLMH